MSDELREQTFDERWVTFECAAHLLGFRRTDDLYVWLCARGIRFDGRRVLACPRCGSALPPATSLFGHVCPASSTTSIIAPGSVIVIPVVPRG